MSSSGSASINTALDAHYGAFIGGAFRPIGDETFPAINAATGAHLANIARCDARAVDDAVRAARAALPGWRATSYEERSALLLKLADALDIGRRLSETMIDHMIAKREPVGVCGQIIPWNVPAIMVAFNWRAVHLSAGSRTAVSAVSFATRR